MLALSIDYSEKIPFNACCLKEFQSTVEIPRKADERLDFVSPAVIFPGNRFYLSWGEENIRKMVTHHHTLLRESSVGNFFPRNDAKFEFATKKTADFFVEALNGVETYSFIHRHPALKMRYFQMTIDEKAREIWLMTYKKTIKDLAMPAEFIEEFWNWIEALSIHMINRRTTVMDIPRFYYSQMFE